ncbi:HAD-IB family phosphatase [Desulfovirgula thermocuniculi]|uniref:HAD-IB family phosphatase n=1 Tax=Desulfovirgula thermocuniculi TaxID=348842 RepID=UPI00040C5001|nr:HAD-IB family phosphatase [Desulfovirgula thermocuniculi]
MLPEEGEPAMLEMVAFDMDGTLTPVRSSWEYVHRRLGLWSELAVRYQEDFLAGRICYAEFCRRDAALWRGMSRRRLEEVVREIPLRPLARELVRALKERGVKVVLISSGLDLLAERVAAELDLDGYVANGLAARNGHLTGEPVVRVSHDEPGKLKKDHLLSFVARYGCRREAVAAAGDGPGDLDMLSVAARAFLLAEDFREAARLRAAVPHLRVVRDLGQLASQLGIRELEK